MANFGSWGDNEALRLAMQNAAAQDPRLRRRLTVPPMDLSQPAPAGPSRLARDGVIDLQEGQTEDDAYVASMPAAAPETYPDFETWQGDSAVRAAADALSSQEMERVDAQLAGQRERETMQAQAADPLFRQGAEARAAREGMTNQTKAREVNAAIAAQRGPSGPGGVPGATLAQMTTGAAMPQIPAEPPREPSALTQGPVAFTYGKIGQGIKRGLGELGRFFSEPDYIPGQNASPGAPPVAPAQPQPVPPSPAPPAVRAPLPAPIPRRPGPQAPVRVGMATPGAGMEQDAIARAKESIGAPRGGHPLQVALQNIIQQKGQAPASGLEDAFRESGDRRLTAGLARAGAMAIGRGNERAYDVLDRNAEVPLEEFAAKDALSQRDAAVKSAAARLAEERGFKVALQDRDFAQREKMARLTAQGRVDAAKARRGAGVGAREADIQKLGKDTEGYAQIAGDLSTLEQAIGANGDIPGAGWWDANKPALFQSGADIDNRQAAGRVFAALLHETSGASVTPSEAERQLEARGFFKSEEHFKKGISSLLRDYRATAKAKQGKYRPEVARELKARGGFTADQLGGGGGPAGRGLGRPPSSEADLGQMTDDELRAFLGAG